MQLAVKGSGPPGVGAQTAPDRVYRDLRERIINFDLPPGTTLSRSELTETFGVSQTPVREALQRLEQEGLVLIYPQSKTVVSRIDVRQLSETHFLRVAIESEVVRRLATSGNRNVIRRTQAILDMQKALVATEEEMPMFAELDRSFHLALFEAVGMENLHHMLLARLGHLYRCQRLELPQQVRRQSIVAAHQSIIDGLSEGDPEAAVAAMRDHLSGTISRVASLRLEFPDYFTNDEFRFGGDRQTRADP